MINFSEAKSIFEAVTELVKKAATLDLQEKIISLREFVIALKDENISLKEENQTLKRQFQAEQDFELKNGLYWKDGEEVPYCQKCYDGSRKSIHLQRYSDGWKCFECGKYYAPPGRGGGAYIHHPKNYI